MSTPGASPDPSSPRSDVERAAGPRELQIDLVDKISSGITTHFQVRQEVIITTKDKIDLALRKALPKYATRTAWVAPASVLLSLVLALTTTTFQLTWGISPDAWKAAFAVGALVAAAWTVWGILRSIRHLSYEQLLDAIAATSDPSEAALPVRRDS